MKKIKIPSQFTKLTTRVDRTYKLEFSTGELKGDKAADLMSMLMDECWLLIASEDKLKETDVPDEKADSMTNSKTQAQRLRATLFVLWEQRGKQGDFEDFYKTRMERIIEQVKSNLE